MFAHLIFLLAFVPLPYQTALVCIITFLRNSFPRVPKLCRREEATESGGVLKEGVGVGGVDGKKDGPTDRQTNTQNHCQPVVSHTRKKGRDRI